MTTMTSPIQKRDWMCLPNDILTSMILPYLVSSQDYIRFSVVCKHWHSVAKAEKRNHMATRNQTPFLLIPTKDMWSLYSVPQDRLLDFKLRIPYRNRRICGSSHGWLIFAGDDNVIKLFNPFTEAEISLPRITYHRRYCFVWKVVLSLDPSLHPNDYTAAACFSSDSPYVLALIRPSISSEWWTLTHSDLPQVIYGSSLDMMFDRSGKWVYASIQYSGMVVRADLEGQVLETVVKPWTSEGAVSLVESSSGGDLLMFTGLYYGDNVQGWKLQGSSFVEVDGLVRDRAAFIGQNSSTTLVGRGGFQGAETDCVYYYCTGSYNIHKFNFKDGNVELLNVPKGLPSDYNCCNRAFDPVWILPSVNL